MNFQPKILIYWRLNDFSLNFVMKKKFETLWTIRIPLSIWRDYFFREFENSKLWKKRRKKAVNFVDIQADILKRYFTFP